MSRIPFEYYRRIGAALFPLCPGSKNPTFPHALVQSFARDCSTDLKQWLAWESANPGCNFGVVAFRSAWIVADLDVKKNKGGQITVEIKGVDIYDPTTGEIRSHSTDDIACWFIDTDYNEESFFVRHAYFTGADRPYARLKKALRTEIDEEAWSSLYTTKSRPFDAPKTGKIAVKVINHYGDEVLKVYEV